MELGPKHEQGRTINRRALTIGPRRVEARPRRVRVVERIALRPQTCRTRTLFLPGLVEERFLSLGQEFFDGQLLLRVLRIQLAQFVSELPSHTTILVCELIITKELSGKWPSCTRKRSRTDSSALFKGEFCFSSTIVAIDSTDSLEIVEY